MKESAKYVCACLSALGISGLNAETMRQAKFNGQGVVSLPALARALALVRALRPIFCRALASASPL